MSLVTTAAILNDTTDTTNDTVNFIQQRKKTHNKTQKYNKSFNSKVNSVLADIHNQPEDNDNDNVPNYTNQMEEFAPLTPLPPPTSVGSTERIKQNVVENMNNLNPSNTPYVSNTKDTDLNELKNNFMSKEQTEQYYSQLYPKYNKQIMNSENINDSITNKLNYMIELMEEQQDQKTDSTMEDIILYSFLGVFVIFVVDGFVKVGKYKR